MVWWLFVSGHGNNVPFKPFVIIATVFYRVAVEKLEGRDVERTG